MSDAPTARLEALRRILRDIGPALVAFSAGADSTFLLRVAREELGLDVVAATVRSCLITPGECEDAAEFCRREGVAHVIVDMDVLDVPGVAENEPDRCYHCKKAIFTRLAEVARARGLNAVVEGTNVDDDCDWRPGRRALGELGVRSPLHEAGLTKTDIRALSRAMGLPTADKPPLPCLATRFPYGERITVDGVMRAGRAEEWLRAEFPELGALRVRSHGALARIEVGAPSIAALAARAADISGALRAIGFKYVSLDLTGYRKGSLNETLKNQTSARAAAT